MPLQAQVGTPVSSGQTVTVNSHNECRQVTNPSEGTRMVFTGTAAEWQSFRNNPNGLIMAACAGPAACTTGPVGTACNDGTIYAGTYAGKRLYAAATDAPLKLYYNDGTYYNHADAGSMSDGMDNTHYLRMSERGGQIHIAARECYSKGANWYLPAVEELKVLQTNKAAIGGFKSEPYWTSTEGTSYEDAYVVYFNNDANAGRVEQFKKDVTARVRCVRN